MTDAPPLTAQTLAQDTRILDSPSPRWGIASRTTADQFECLDDLSDDAASISSSILDYPHPRHHRRPLPPLPDLRFEQSYLASIAAAQGVWWRVVLITLKDQVVMPLLQGLGFNLALFGWRWWNRGVKFSGAGVGAKVRRWWWGVNRWEIPGK